MAKYVLEEMLRVRNFRKDIAERNLKQAQRLLEEAKANVTKAEKTLADFKIFMEKESERLYQKIMRQKVKKGSVDELYYAIKVLKNKLITHEQNLDAAKDNLVKSEQNLEEKRIILQDANKNVEKINSHKADWMKEALKEEELALDKELEEFAKSKASVEEF
ncbi:MAG: type III secretion protein [Puniceicoccales bacterium]|jgi:type III secretion protein O|nr:type III secretion protein [Puniceicoccales bacterium]